MGKRGNGLGGGAGGKREGGGRVGKGKRKGGGGRERSDLNNG